MSMVAYYQNIINYITTDKYKFIHLVDSGDLLCQNWDTKVFVIIKKIYLQDCMEKVQVIKKDIDNLNLIADHPHIVKFIESFYTETIRHINTLLVFKYDENSVSLINYIESNNLHENELKNIFNGMARALDHLHSLDIILGHHITINDFIIVLNADIITVKLHPINLIKFSNAVVIYRTDIAPELNIYNAIHTKASNCWDLGLIFIIMIFKTYNAYDECFENLDRKTKWDALSRPLQQLIGKSPINIDENAIPNSLRDLDPISRITTQGILQWFRDTNWEPRRNFAVFNFALSTVLNIILLKNSCKTTDETTCETTDETTCETTCKTTDETTCETTNYKHAEIIFFHLRFCRHISTFL